MSFGAELVARVLGLPEVPVRFVRRVIGGFLVVMMFAMPITFRHGIELYAQREAQQLEHRFIDPLIAQLQKMQPAPPPQPTSTRPPTARAVR